MNRIQCRRTAGWRMPEGAVYVGRPSKWGNPYTLADVERRFPSLTLEQCRGFVVSEFRDLMRAARRAPLLRPTITDSLPATTTRGGRGRRTVSYPSLEEIRRELAGATALACWCDLCPAHRDGLPIGLDCLDCPPCHADYLGREVLA